MPARRAQRAHDREVVAPLVERLRQRHESPSADAAISSSAKRPETSAANAEDRKSRADSYAGDAACSARPALIARGRLAAATGLRYLTSASVTSRSDGRRPFRRRARRDDRGPGAAVLRGRHLRRGPRVGSRVRPRVPVGIVHRPHARSRSAPAGRSRGRSGPARRRRWYGAAPWSPPPSARPCDPVNVAPTREPGTRARRRCRAPLPSAPPTPALRQLGTVVRDERVLGPDDPEAAIAVAERQRNHLGAPADPRELLDRGERHVAGRNVGVIDAGQHELQRAAFRADDEVDARRLAREPLSSSRESRITSVIVATPTASSAR